MNAAVPPTPSSGGPPPPASPSSPAVEAGKPTRDGYVPVSWDQYRSYLHEDVEKRVWSRVRNFLLFFVSGIGLAIVLFVWKVGIDNAADQVRGQLGTEVTRVLLERANVLATAIKELNDQVRTEVDKLVPRIVGSDETTRAVRQAVDASVTRALEDRVRQVDLKDEIVALRSAEMIENPRLPAALRMSLLVDLVHGQNGRDRLAAKFLRLADQGRDEVTAEPEEALFVAQAARAVLVLLTGPGAAGDAAGTDPQRALVVDSLAAWCVRLAAAQPAVLGEAGAAVRDALAAVRDSAATPAHVAQLAGLARQMAAPARHCATLATQALATIATEDALWALVAMVRQADAAVQDAAWNGARQLRRLGALPPELRHAVLRALIDAQAAWLAHGADADLMRQQSELHVMRGARRYGELRRVLEAVAPTLAPPSTSAQPARATGRPVAGSAPAEAEQDRYFRQWLAALLAQHDQGKLLAWRERTRLLAGLIRLDPGARETERTLLVQGELAAPRRGEDPRPALSARLATLLMVWAAAAQATNEAEDAWRTLDHALVHRDVAAGLDDPALGWVLIDTEGTDRAATPDPQACQGVLQTALERLRGDADALQMLIPAAFACLVRAPQAGTRTGAAPGSADADAPLRLIALARALQPLQDASTTMRRRAAKVLMLGLPPAPRDAEAGEIVVLIDLAARLLEHHPDETGRSVARHLVALADADIDEAHRTQLGAAIAGNAPLARLATLDEELPRSDMPSNVAVAARTAVRGLFPWLAQDIPVIGLGGAPIRAGCSFLPVAPALLLRPTVPSANRRYVLELATESGSMPAVLYVADRAKPDAERVRMAGLQRNRIARQIVTMPESGVLALLPAPEETCARLRPVATPTSRELGDGLWEIRTADSSPAARARLSSVNPGAGGLISLSATWLGSDGPVPTDARFEPVRPGIRSIRRIYANAQVFMARGSVQVVAPSSPSTLLVEVQTIRPTDAAPGEVQVVLSDATPETWFAVRLAPGQTIHAETQTPSQRADPTLALFDQDMQELDSDERSGPHRNAAQVAFGPVPVQRAAGTYYLRAAQYGGTFAGAEVNFGVRIAVE